MLNWLEQTAAITGFGLRSLPERKGAALAAAAGIAGVVAVLLGVLSIAEGIRKAVRMPQADDAVIVLRAGADGEMTSGLSRDEIRLIADTAGIARTPAGPLASPELFVIINLPSRSTGTDANVPLRGVAATALAIRTDMKIVEGRMFDAGRNEVVVGNGAARAFAGLNVGQKLRVGLSDWEVVGRFSGGGGGTESEIWADASVLQSAYHRGDSFQSVYARLTSPNLFLSFSNALAANPQLKAKAVRLPDFFAEQSSMTAGFIQFFGYWIAGLMALGALFAALNTMYGAVAARTREIATLRALGFGTSPVIVSILCESLVLALVGGTIGGTAAYLAFNGFETSTINFKTFSQVAFAFAVTPKLLVTAIIWASFIGLIGGFFPALRAARLAIAAGLRET